MLNRYSRLAEETDAPQSMLHGIVNSNNFATLNLLFRIMIRLKVNLSEIFPAEKQLPIDHCFAYYHGAICKAVESKR